MCVLFEEGNFYSVYEIRVKSWVVGVTQEISTMPWDLSSLRLYGESKELAIIFI